MISRAFAYLDKNTYNFYCLHFVHFGRKMAKINENLRQDYAKITPKMKLPKPRKRGDVYRIELMLDGKRISATRDTEKECKQWAAEKILEFKARHQKPDDKQTMQFGELLQLYHSRVGKNKPSASTESMYNRCLIRDSPWLANMQIHNITAKDLTLWRNERLVNVSAGTVRREIAYFSSVLSYAVTELFAIKTNPFAKLAKPEMPKSRNRRITDSEIQTVLDASTYKLGTVPKQTQHYVAWCFVFAVHTAMRRGEILGIKKTDIKDGYIHLPKTKNGEARNVPLTPIAKEMLTWIEHDDAMLIPLSLDSFKKSWQRVQKKANIDDLTFHDTRHEAISRMVKDLRLPVEILAKITGHKDIKTLINVYYNPNIDELLDVFNNAG